MFGSSSAKYTKIQLWVCTNANTHTITKGYYITSNNIAEIRKKNTNNKGLPQVASRNRRRMSGKYEKKTIIER